MTEPVRIIKNQDGTYSLWVYSTEVCRGTFEECEQRARFE